MKESGILYVIKRLGISVGGGIIVLAILLAIASAIALGTGDPDPLLLPLSMTCLALSCTVTGFVSAKTCSEYMGALLSSLFATLFFVLLMFLTGLFFTSESTGFGMGINLLVYGGMILLGLLGGIIGRPRTKKKPRHVRRNRR